MTDTVFSSYQPLSRHARMGAIKNSLIWKIGQVILILLLIGGAYIIGNKTATSTTNSTKTSVTKPFFFKNINMDFTFPVKDAEGTIVTNLTYSISSIDLQNQIILEGQKADAVSGRTFLIINLRLVNPSAQNLQINTRNFIRVAIDNSPELLAPEIHNDPVTIQPISTKFSRLGLPINDTVKNVTLHVGEIGGPKTIINIPITK